MSYYQRLLKIELPNRQSAFLWGARKTGKSTYLLQHFPNAVYYDLLQTNLYFKFSKEPYRFRDEILALSDEQLKEPVIVDEVQKVPPLLDEIHWLIENTKAQFILCGSSARKLRKTGANLLGGRAWRYEFYPLVYPEISDFDLLRVLTHGTVPEHYTSDNIHKALSSYIQDYLNEEIRAEGLVRNLPAFARFLDSLGFSQGEMINYSNIARECGIDAKTVKEYYQILIDTLLGYFVYPYRKKRKRDIILSVPKFYLFDVGVAGHLAQRRIESLRGPTAGKALEHYVLMELMAYKGLNDVRFDITYWRTKSGLEVDFILGDASVALEVKISDRVQKKDLSALFAFAEEHKTKQNYVVCLEERPRKITVNNHSVTTLPLKMFLEKLWSGEIIKGY